MSATAAILKIIRHASHGVLIKAIENMVQTNSENDDHMEVYGRNASSISGLP
jgi:hypothetical protein